MNSTTVFIDRGCNHLLHLVLTLITCGLWSPVWALMAFLAARRRQMKVAPLPQAWSNQYNQMGQLPFQAPR